MEKESLLTERLQEIFERLLARYGGQRWWPADTPFEVMVGAVLTQATSWANVELAIARLKDAGALSPSAIRDMDAAELAALIYSSGFYNIKARRLKALVKFIGDAYGDSIDAMRAADCDTLRRELLAVSGIGEETADAILLYALDKPVFVVDAYSRRLTERLGIAPQSQSYGAHQRLFTDNLPHDRALFANNLPQDTALFVEYHALIVEHGKQACRKTPVCASCCLVDVCATGMERNSRE
ncbi:MAG: endonuclease [Chloroflexi bacterium]|nr:endonuclease [Chloroflexota bacterium]